MSNSSSRSGIEPDDDNSTTGQSVANYETNWNDKDLNNWQLPDIQKDKRITDYKESILGMAETTLTYGPIYFQCYPNFTIALNTDEHKEKCLVIDIQTHNYKFIERSSPYKLVYRVHYRVLTSGLIPSFIPLTIPAGQTICFSASPSVNVMVPAPVKWENIAFPDEWIKEKIDQPSYQPPSRNLHDCITDHDGTLKISFRRDHSLRLPSISNPPSENSFQTARHSLSSLSREHIANQIPSLILKGKGKTPYVLIPHDQYHYKPESSDTEDQGNLIHRRRRKPSINIDVPTHVTNILKTPNQTAHPIHKYDEPTSPTPSQALTDSVPSGPTIRTIDVIDSEINSHLLAEYHAPNNKNLRQKYETNYSPKKRQQFHERWLSTITKLNQDIPFFKWYSNRKSLEEQCLVLNQNRNRTYKTKHGDLIQLHPPPRNFDIDIFNEDTDPVAFTTTSCSPFVIMDTDLSNNIASSSAQVGAVIKQNNYTNIFLNTLGEQLDEIELNMTTSSSIHKSSKSDNPQELLKSLEERLKNQPKPEIHTIDDMVYLSETEIDNIEQMINKITTTDKVDSYNHDRYYHNTKPYYPRPTPPDLQYEETVPYRAYTAKETIIHHTKEIITTIPSSSITTSATTTTSQPDGIDVLCYTILMHFVGNPNRFQGKEFSKLQNLKCKRLSDFKWYKDIFLTSVLQRSDNANSYWKEKFISGLPTLFSTKVRDKMIEQNASSDWSQIDLNTWTYGEIINTINIVATKRELGSWCEQFGFDKLPISKRKHSKNKSKRTFHNKPPNSTNPRFRRWYKNKKPLPKSKPSPSTKPKTKQSRKQNTKKSKTVKCFNCGQEMLIVVPK
ncbi:hypothetical protein Dsin_005836 [Dipteronia sinensis]|uniref:DUF7588 domain-containing protein n=1 Tax=Dipteronia sinensis TaxID=43782 RepID=A0AAE0AYI5_9ROSI|nr:hypothetical protein Dsin_005836 [Dipteronia sinensis]